MPVVGAYCQRHQELRPKRASASKRGYGRVWRRIREDFLRANPLCVDPMKRHLEKVVPSFEPHHIIPKAEGGSDEWDNLMALCSDCHKALEARQRKSGAVI